MVERYRSKSVFYSVVGLLLQALGYVLHIPVLGWAIAGVGSLFLCLGVAYYARSKGRAALWGVLGVCSLPTMLPGLLLLAVLPDRSKQKVTF